MSFLDLEDSLTLDRHKRIMSDVYRRINCYHKRPLHSGQVQIAKKFFVENKRIIQIQCGRSFGKTEVLLYVAWVYALLNDNVLVYIICPERTQAKKIYWTSRRLQDYGPQEYVAEHRDSDLITVLKNGSKIVLDGCENYNSLRGIKPHLVFYDEFQHHNREFDMEVMQPNLMSKNSRLIVMGTPPKRDCYYVEFRKRLLESIQEGNTTRWYTEAPSAANPSLDRDALAEKKKELYKMGDEKIWLREHEGKLIFGGEGAIFPTWERRNHIYNLSSIKLFIDKDKHKLKWFTICDPGTSSCFAVLFGCYNPYTSQLYLLDEIYEKDRKRTDTNQIWGRIRAKELALYPEAAPNTWKRYYDEAAAWFQREVQANFRENLSPTDKYHRDEEADISVIKSLMTEESHFFVAEKCEKLIWEIENYVTDEKGRYPDAHDHLIDCLRYLVYAARVKLVHDVDLSAQKSEDPWFQPIQPAMSKVDVAKGEDWTDSVSDTIGYYDNFYDA